MTWEELKQKAKEMGKNKIAISYIIFQDDFWFDEDGEFGISNNDGSYEIVKCGRTPDQMLAIMKALQ